MTRADPRSPEKIRQITDEDLFASLDGFKSIESWKAHWESLAVSRSFFSNIDDFLTTRDQATQSIINGKDSILALADQVLKHNIKGWGPTPIQHGPVVDFNADYGQSGKYGFHYWAWARPLVQSFLCTSDQKYLDEFELLFNQWYDQRDKVVGGFPNLDPVYYELGLGVRNRLFLEYYFLPHEKRSLETHRRLLKAFLGAARWLHEEERLSYRPHNWQMIGSYGLAQIGLTLPEFRDAKSWVEMGTQRIIEHLEKDFFPDGCFADRCPSSYNIIAFRDPRNLGHLLDRNDTYKNLATKIHAPLDRQSDFLTALVAPDNYLPGINDGARAPLPNSISSPNSERRTPNAGSRHFAPSGFTVMRSPDHYMLINHGPSGGGHSHADALSFELHAHGQAIAIDSGIGDTYDDPAWSSWYIHAPAHNMLTIDASDPDRAASEGKDITWQSTKEFDHFAATHHGYTNRGVTHRRHMLFVKPNYFLIYDVITATKEVTAEWNLHPTIALDKQQSPGLSVATSAPWKKESSQAWASVPGIPGFGGKNQTQIEWLRFTSKLAPGTTEFAVLLHPFATARPDVILVSRAPATFTVSINNQQSTIYFQPTTVTVK